MNNTPKNYAFPIGDYLSGFSDDPKSPCDYELECQRMVIRGVQYFNEHPEVHKEITDKKSLTLFDPLFEDLIAFMLDGNDGQTGGMVSQCVLHSYHAYKLGWDEYVAIMGRKKEDDDKR